MECTNGKGWCLHGPFTSRIKVFACKLIERLMRMFFFKSKTKYLFCLCIGFDNDRNAGQREREREYLSLEFMIKVFCISTDWDTMEMVLWKFKPAFILCLLALDFWTLFVRMVVCLDIGCSYRLFESIIKPFSLSLTRILLYISFFFLETQLWILFVNWFWEWRDCWIGGLCKFHFLPEPNSLHMETERDIIKIIPPLLTNVHTSRRKLE